MGIISIQKGVHYLIQAWKKLNIHEGELLLVGSFEKLSKKIISTEAKGAERVVFRGGTATPEREFKKSDIFAFPSNQDGFGSVVLEAMACGLPVIVSENTGAKDCVRDGIDGFIVPAADVDALCDRINYFYTNRDKVREMGRRAREQALKYDWESYRKRLAGS
ncbi:L-malate glycosyltransferase, partial [Candidatus Hakubella thermalkaliphila]